MEFSLLKAAVAKQFQAMQKHTLYRTSVKGEDLWETYLASFPTGTDIIYRERTEHDCHACRSFIKHIGSCVAIVDGELISLWDVMIGDPNYQLVVNALSQAVKSQPIENLFLYTQTKAGIDKNFEQILNDSKAWEHFFVNLPASVVVDKKNIGELGGKYQAIHDVMLRSLTEITVDSIKSVLELIDQNSIYRGTEQKFAVTEFEKLKQKFDAAKDKDRFVWEHIKSIPESVSRIRNTSIGTLLTDISEGKELEDAVKAFESKVAPQNYKRPTALITKGMVAKAQEKIEELGLMSALSRRPATLSDITVNNILHANRSAKAQMNNIFDELTASLPEKAKNYDKVEEVTIDKFIADVLPRTESIEVLLENRHANNLVSLIAPTDPTAGRLFKWDNNFSWDYAGGLADSDIRKAVQGRGGSVDGVFRFSHSWNHHPGKQNASLMDLHVFMPGNTIKAENGVNDLYGNNHRVGWSCRKHSLSGGDQDVDFVRPAPEGYVPVENITFPTLSKMPEGEYICKIHNWQERGPTTSGFSAEIEFGGEVFQYDYPKPLKNKEWVTVAVVKLRNGKFTIEHKIPESPSTRILWGLPTQSFHKANVVMYSPNYWDGQGVGNRHYFFMLEGAVREGTARGFYNEFLRSDLDPYRKAFEMVGSRMQSEGTSEQLSGLAFNSTTRNDIVLRVKGATSRLLKVTF